MVVENTSAQVFFGSARPERGGDHSLRMVAHSLFVDTTGTIQDVLVHDKPKIRYTDPAFAVLTPHAMTERLDYRLYRSQNGTPAEVAFIGGLHGDEWTVPEIVDTLLGDSAIPRVEAWNVHVLAGVLGRREWVRPFGVGETTDTVSKREQIHMKNSKEVRRGGVLGRKIDLNRQFTIPEDAASWEDVFATVLYPEATLLLEMSKDNPDIKYLFAFHEDPEFGHDEQPTPRIEQLTRDGVYFYDVPPDARKDQSKILIDTLKTKLSLALTEAGFSMFHGVDDPDDPALGYFSDHGYIYQPNITMIGERKLDGTFESAMVELGRLGINKMERAFTFEVPGGLTPERKTRIMEIIIKNFVLPFLAEKGVAE